MPVSHDANAGADADVDGDANALFAMLARGARVSHVTLGADFAMRARGARVSHVTPGPTMVTEPDFAMLARRL